MERTSVTSVRKLGPRCDVVVISVSVTCASCRSMPSAVAIRAIEALTRYEPVPADRLSRPTRSTTPDRRISSSSSSSGTVGTDP